MLHVRRWRPVGQPAQLTTHVSEKSSVAAPRRLFDQGNSRQRGAPQKNTCARSATASILTLAGVEPFVASLSRSE